MICDDSSASRAGAVIARICVVRKTRRSCVSTAEICSGVKDLTWALDRARIWPVLSAVTWAVIKPGMSDGCIAKILAVGRLENSTVLSAASVADVSELCSVPIGNGMSEVVIARVA